MIFSIIAASGLAILVLVIFLIFERAQRAKKIKTSLTYVAVLVKIPKPSPKPGEAPKSAPELIAPFEQFIANLTSLKIPISLEVAVENFGEAISFYVACPRNYVEFISKQVQSFWPGSEAQEFTHDYNIFNPQGFALQAVVGQKASWHLPVKTYIQLANFDPFEAILGTFSKLAKDGEGLAFQIILKPAPGALHKKIQQGLKKLKEGKSLKQAFSSDILKEIETTLNPPSQSQKQKEAEKPKTVDEIAVKNLEAKVQKPLFETNLNLVASADSKERAEQILKQAEGGFNQFFNPGFNEFSVLEPGGKELMEGLFNFSYRIFNPAKKSILTSEEIASIFHFPLAITQTPNINWLRFRSAPPPINLPEQGLILGESIWRNEKRLVRLTNEDRRRHLYIVGQTGTGKTALFQEMLRQDIETGNGVCFIDPHGDAAETILGLVPRQRVEDVIYFSPGDLKRPIGLNMLEFDERFPEQKTFIINELIEIVDKLYNLRETGGPMFEQYLRNALLLIMDDPGAEATLLDLPRVFSDEDFRAEKLAEVKNILVREFWLKEAERVSGEASLANMTPYITSKFSPFISNDYIRPIIAQKKSAVNFRQIMDQGKILVINLAKGQLGDTNSYLLGMILVGKILMAALSRADIPENQRKDFNLYLDEFQNITTRSISTILSEARKYRLDLTIAHQFIGQLQEDIKKAVFGNVGTMVSFRIGVEDAEFLEKQFAPVFNQNDLINLDNFNAYIKLLISGQTSPAFNIVTLPPKPPSPEMKNQIIELSRQKYGQGREQIEKEIQEKYQSSRMF